MSHSPSNESPSCVQTDGNIANSPFTDVAEAPCAAPVTETAEASNSIVLVPDPIIRLSVVICTFDRYEALAETIRILVTSSSFTETAAEILIVENTPADRRLPIAMPDTPRVRLTVCETVGLSAARNHGITEAHGEIIAFIDDDALVCDNWCSVLLAVFDELPEVSVVGGKVMPHYPSTPLPPWYDDQLSRYLSCVDWTNRPRFLRAGEWIVGANMAFRRSVFQRFGAFDTSLGRKGAASLLSNEDTALLDRIGMRSVFYDPRMAVEHVIPTDRLTPAWFRRRAYWQAVSDMVAGLTRPGDPAMRSEYGSIISQLEASRRNLHALQAEPRDYAEFSLQLRAIYLASVALGGGL